MKYIPPLNSSENDEYQDATETIPGSVVPAKFFNIIQKEILNAIIGAGINPNGDDDTQLSAAINKFIVTNKPDTASKTKTGIVQIGDYINVTNNGLISISKASKTNFGVIKLGNGLILDENGNLTIENPTDIKDGATSLNNNLNNLTITGTYFVRTIQNQTQNPPKNITADWWIKVSSFGTDPNTMQILQEARMHSTTQSNTGSGSAHILSRCGSGKIFGPWEYSYTMFAG